MSDLAASESRASLDSSIGFIGRKYATKKHYPELDLHRRSGSDLPAIHTNGRKYHQDSASDDAWEAHRPGRRPLSSPNLEQIVSSKKHVAAPLPSPFKSKEKVHYDPASLVPPEVPPRRSLRAVPDIGASGHSEEYSLRDVLGGVRTGYTEEMKRNHIGAPPEQLASHLPQEYSLDFFKQGATIPPAFLGPRSIDQRKATLAESDRLIRTMRSKETLLKDLHKPRLSAFALQSISDSQNGRKRMPFSVAIAREERQADIKMVSDLPDELPKTADELRAEAEAEAQRIANIEAMALLEAQEKANKNRWKKKKGTGKSQSVSLSKR